MELSLTDVQNVFEDLIAGRISREDADRWAYARMQSFDSNDLLFHPKAEEELLWDAVQYLYGIDTKVSPDEYMHSIEDIETEYLSRWKGR
jgi:hemerythrin superfamily protein